VEPKSLYVSRRPGTHLAMRGRRSCTAVEIVSSVAI
jgi:hypothetical protein